MASEEHQQLANTIKSVHKELRENTQKYGVEMAWSKHLENKQLLQSYATSMNRLATEFWEQRHQQADINKGKQNDVAKDCCTRIQWSVKYCLDYFLNQKLFMEQRKRELMIIANKLSNSNVVDLSMEQQQLPQPQTLIDDYTNKKLKLLDVGSCYNPFSLWSQYFDVLAIDLTASKCNNVFECDFLNVTLNDDNKMHANNNDNKINSLSVSSFNIIIFSLLLEYLPTPEQRLKCCQNAYELLVPEGILIIITPDSKQLNSNVRLMKTWRYTLALLGLHRIKFEKQQHITCMVFRKVIDKRVAVRWATIHYEPTYMNFEIKIPQDIQKKINNNNNNCIDSNSNDNDVDDHM